MILAVKNPSPKIAPKLNYDVLIENQADGIVKATLLGLPDYQSIGTTKEEALDNLIQLLQQQKQEIVTFQLQSSETENPWLKIAGKYKDDPQFDQMLEYIEEYRHELDSNNESR